METALTEMRSGMSSFRTYACIKLHNTIYNSKFSGAPVFRSIQDARRLEDF
jgi:hypothetical protein